jgi:hypothetical protein
VLGAVLLEAIAGNIGGVLVASAILKSSTVAAIVGMILWVVSFEPLLKLSTGTALGVKYEYAYLYGGVEPRFKMNFGSYLAISPFKRAIVQVSGMIGAALGALIAASLFDGTLPTAHVVALIVFWLTVLANLADLVAGITGIRRIGPIRMPEGSATMAIIELGSLFGAKRRVAS